MADPFHKKSIITTGASSGLGAALALELARRGANLALFSPEAEQQEEVASRCRQLGGEAVAVIGDVTNPEDCKRLADECAGRFGGVDYLVANAGISMWTSFEEVEDLEIFRRLTEVNYLGAVNCIYHALPHLKNSRGMIVAITSIQAKIGVPKHTGYVASKHALQGFCEALRLELKDAGVDILTVLPHWISGTDLRKRAVGRDGGILGRAARKHSGDAIPVDEACRAIVRAMEKRQRELVMPAKLKALLWLSLLSPRIADVLIERAVGRQR